MPVISKIYIPTPPAQSHKFTWAASENNTSDHSLLGPRKKRKKGRRKECDFQFLDEVSVLQKLSKGRSRVVPCNLSYQWLIRWYVDANDWYVDCSTERLMLCAGVLLIWSISLIYWVWLNVIQCDTFLNTHAPRKTKIWPNSHQFMTKAFRKAIMTKSKKSKIRKMDKQQKTMEFLY